MSAGLGRPAQLERTPTDPDAQRAYNYALGRIFSLIRAHNFNPWAVPLKVGRFTFTYKKIPRAGWNPSIYEFLPTDQVEVSGEYLTSRAARDGLGASLVAIGRTGKADPRRTFSQDRTYAGFPPLPRSRAEQIKKSAKICQIKKIKKSAK